HARYLRRQPDSRPDERRVLQEPGLRDTGRLRDPTSPAMKTQAQKANAFRTLHEREGAFIIPNPWDAGTARLLTALGFEALATTSLGTANTLGAEGGAGAPTHREGLATV